MIKLNISRILSTLLIGFLFFTASSCNNNDDKEVQENVNKKLQEAGTSGINTTVKDGVVTLTGTCEGDDCAGRIEKQLADIKGVKKVENNIEKDQSTDLTLRTSVQSIISKYQGVQADVAGGMIVLRGSIERTQVQPLMNELEALQPKKIDNQLAVNQ